MRKVLAVVVLCLSVAGCGGGGGKSCGDACTNLFNCASQLGVALNAQFGANAADCTSDCNARASSNKQSLVDCVAGLHCSNAAQLDTDLTSCCNASPGACPQ